MEIAQFEVKLKEVFTNSYLMAVIEPMTLADFKVVKKSREQFDKFNWNQYRQKEVYKLRLKEDDIILGLMCLIDHTDEATDAIEIELLEVSSENIGKEKRLDCIGGCLIAFACRESFKRGHEGCVFLVPKSSLLDHYPAKYGFQYIPVKSDRRPNGFMILFEPGARKLIKMYLDAA
ncbi:hypothetical protein SAMN04488128_10826 [Chitinophaga eiseniae]|uniref:N-acetyltransferase domain-containing protein n=1 Tax=Chitinophaga eiseniae TaxID=634771 RepID=A0A1T4U293_9BACT|nr:hypothetical protein [Chitinophaga eiseniae]SKA46783.1 hypothetical protein SAMN04488128_10826 [Chitinophaga eiseniae]